MYKRADVPLLFDQAPYEEIESYKMSGWDPFVSPYFDFLAISYSSHKPHL